MTTFYFDGPEAIAANYSALFIDRLNMLHDLKNAMIAEFSREEGYLYPDHHPTLYRILFPKSAIELEEEVDELVEIYDSEHDWGIFDFTQTAIGVLGVSMTHLDVSMDTQRDYTMLAKAWFNMAAAIHPIYEEREDSISRIQQAKHKAKTEADRAKLENQSPLRLKTSLAPYRSELKRHLNIFEGALLQIEKDIKAHEPAPHLADERIYNLELIDSLKDMLVQLKKDAYLDGQGFGSPGGDSKKS